jgi:hypothetical protein
LDRDDIGSSERFVRDEIPPCFGLDSEEVDRGHVEDVALEVSWLASGSCLAYSGLQEDNVDVRREDLVGDGVVHLTFGILHNQLDAGHK